MYVCGTETQGTVNHLCLHICQDPETGTMHINVFFKCLIYYYIVREFSFIVIFGLDFRIMTIHWALVKVSI